MITEILGLLLGCTIAAIVCFLAGAWYHRAKREYLDAERDYLESLGEKENGDDEF